MLNHVRRMPLYSQYTRPMPPPNRKDMFLLGFLLGVIVGCSYPWKEKLKYQSFF